MISISPISSLFAQSLNYQPRSPHVKMAFNSYQQLSSARRRGPDPPVWVNSGFLNFDTIDTWDQIILCPGAGGGGGRGWERLSYAFKVFGSIPGLQPLNDSSNPPMWQSEMPPDCTPFENHWIKHTPPNACLPRCPSVEMSRENPDRRVTGEGMKCKNTVTKLAFCVTSMVALLQLWWELQWGKVGADSSLAHAAGLLRAGNLLPFC